MVCDGGTASPEGLTVSAHRCQPASDDSGHQGGLDAGETPSDSPQRRGVRLVWSLGRMTRVMEEGGRLGGCGVIYLGQWEEEKGLVWDLFWKWSPSRGKAGILWDSHGHARSGTGRHGLWWTCSSRT